MITKNQKQIKAEKEVENQKAKEADFVEIINAGEEKSIVVTVNRVAKVVKGGKRLSFNALVVVGDGNGKVGAALGKANEVQDAIQKAMASARKQMFEIPLINGTIPCEVEGKFCSGHVWMKPAVEGTGVIAGSGVRAVLEAAGVKNILTKNLGSRNPFNTVYATLDALRKLKTKKQVEEIRK